MDTTTPSVRPDCPLSIVAIGGGTGLSAMLRGLKHKTPHLTAVVTTADDGGGSGMLRREMETLIPPGDIRNCLLALAEIEPSMEAIFNYRFDHTSGSLNGQNLGNLFLGALFNMTGDFSEAVRKMSDVLAVTGEVLPVTTVPTVLEAVFENGSSCFGESNISAFKKQQKCRIRRVKLHPEPLSPNPQALERILAADLVVFAPGSLYTSIIPNLLVPGVADALAETRAKRVLCLNIMTQEGETEGMSAFDHALAVERHAGRRVFDVCLGNSTSVPPEILDLYAAEHAEQAVIDPAAFAKAEMPLVLAPLAEVRNDVVRHDSAALCAALWRCCL